MSGKAYLIAILSLTSIVSANAEEIRGAGGANPGGNVHSISSITPIFGQLVEFASPENFVAVFENAHGAHYIREAVPRGETAEAWSQMITITGEKGLAANPDATAQKFAGFIAAGFKRACPETFSAKGFGAVKIDGRDAYVALASCGKAPSDQAAHSETALLIAIRGSEDFYTIQWAERRQASDRPLDLDDPKWLERFKKLGPIKLCEKIPGEPAPYPSCLHRQ